MNAREEEIGGIAALALPWEKLEGKRVLVSGGTGFLGSLLIAVLAKKAAEGRRRHAARP